MTLILELPDNKEAALKAKAQAQRVSAERYAAKVLWIALTNADDLNHQRVLSLSRILHPVHLITTEEVLDEYLAYFSGARRSVREHAGSMVASLIDNREMVVFPQSHDSFTAGLDLYRARSDKGYSLTGCISMVTMTSRGLTDVLTNDRHFAQEGFRALFRN